MQRGTGQIRVDTHSPANVLEEATASEEKAKEGEDLAERERTERKGASTWMVLLRRCLACPLVLFVFCSIELAKSDYYGVSKGVGRIGA